jgi:hypothetical protein
MKGELLPELDQVARHCSYSQLVFENGRAIGVNEAAFLPRPRDVAGISVNWVQFFAGSRPHQIDCIRSITKLKATDKSRIAIVEVNSLKAAAAPFATLIITHDPDDNLPPETNAAHALISPSSALTDKSLRQQLATKVLNLFLYKDP